MIGKHFDLVYLSQPIKHLSPIHGMLKYLKLLAFLLVFTPALKSKAQNSGNSARSLEQTTAKGQTTALEPDFQLLNELQTLQPEGRQHSGESPGYTLHLEEVKRHFPLAITEIDGKEQISYDAMTVVLFSFVKELKLQNEHLAEMVESLVFEKAELERQVATINQQVSQQTAGRTAPKNATHPIEQASQ